MELRYYIIRRILVIVPTILGLILLVFLLFSLIPTSLLIGQLVAGIHRGPNYNKLVEQAIALYGLNMPPYIHFFVYIKDLLIGQWGYMVSPMWSGNVLTAIEIFFPNTIQLAIFSTALSILVAIPLGTYIGARPNSISDQTGRIFSLTGYGMPAFFVAWIVILLFGRGGIVLGNGGLPIQGSIPTIIGTPPIWALQPGTSYLVSTPTHIFIIDAIIHGDVTLAWGAFVHLILPVVTLTYGLLAGVLRYIRAGMVDSMNQEYVKTARSKGVPEGVVIKKHVRKNALIPTITYMGLLLAALLGGAVVVEEVFQYPGIGLLTVNATLGSTGGSLSPQIYGVMGLTLVFGIILMLANLVVDVLYAIMDPRIRY